MLDIITIITFGLGTSITLVKFVQYILQDIHWSKKLNEMV